MELLLSDVFFTYFWSDNIIVYLFSILHIKHTEWVYRNPLYSVQVFNGCPLRIHCTASWIHPETRDQHILIGAEEGIYDLNLNELHETAMDQLYPRRTIWLYVIKDVLMSLSGRAESSLMSLHNWSDFAPITMYIKSHNDSTIKSLFHIKLIYDWLVLLQIWLLWGRKLI